MALTPTPIGDNQFAPGIAAETYVPDQLIAGNLKIVSKSVAISGAAVFQRGAVMGQKTLGTIASSAGKTFASGTVTIATAPAPGDTVTFNGTAIQFVAGPDNPAGLQVRCAATPDAPAPSLAQIAASLMAVAAASSDTQLLKFTYSVAAAVVTATAKAIGTGGNALTLATSDAGAITLSGATLSGGTANAGAETIGSISAGPLLKTGNYSAVLTSTTAANVFDPLGEQLGVATVGTAFVNPQINFTITTGASIAAADGFVLTAAAADNSFTLANAAAIDGSQNPSAVLADYVDCTAGEVTGGVYLMGEFNANVMTFGPGITPPAAEVALRQYSIFLKHGVPADDPL